MYVVSTAPALAFDYILIIVIWPATTLKKFRVLSCNVVDISNILDALDLLNPLYLLDPLEFILPVGSISLNGSFRRLGLSYPQIRDQMSVPDLHLFTVEFLAYKKKTKT